MIKDLLISNLSHQEATTLQLAAGIAWEMLNTKHRSKSTLFLIERRSAIRIMGYRLTLSESSGEN
jgi:hypothetical protein